MSNPEKQVQVGPGFLGILLLIFITLKLCGVIAWSWLWVLSPIWLPLVAAIAIIAITLLILGIAKIG